MSEKLLRATLRLFKDALDASPGDETLEAAQRRVLRSASDLPGLRERLDRVEQRMGQRIDAREVRRLVALRTRLLAEIRELEARR